jgi:hypothetical protein
LTVQEGEETVSLSIQRTGNLSQATSVTVKTVEASATSPEDYTAVNKVVTLNAGVASLIVKVKIKDDLDLEEDETFKVQLSAPSYGYLGTQKTATVTIQDNDGR